MEIQVRFVAGILLVAGAVLNSTHSVTAATVSWDGGGGVDRRWSTDSNWAGNSEPTSVDDVVLGVLVDSFSFTTPGKNFTIRSLALSQHLSLDTNGFNLKVGGQTVINDSGVVRVTGPIVGTGVLSTEGLSLHDFGKLELDRFGILDLTDDSLTIQDAARVSGAGLIYLSESGTGGAVRFVNDSIIEPRIPIGGVGAGFGATLVIANNAGGDGRVDLDGVTGDGFIKLDYSGDDIAGLRVSAPLSDPIFNGGIEIIEGNFLDITSPWSLGNGALLSFYDDSHTFRELARIQGGRMTQAGGEIHLYGNSAATFQAPTTLSSGLFKLEPNAEAVFTGAATLETNANVQIGDGAQVRFLNTTTLSGGTVAIAPGSLARTGQVTFNGDVTVSVGAPVQINSRIDWDGDSEILGGVSAATNTRINPGGILNINGDIVDDFYDGDVSVDNGTLAVTGESWAIRGQLEVSNGGQVTGQQLTVDGPLRTHGIGIIEAPAVMTPAANVVVDSGGRLELRGDTTLLGGKYSGEGTLRQNGTLRVQADTVLGVNTGIVLGAQNWLDVYDWDGANGFTEVFLADNANLTINAESIDSTLNDGFDGTITTLGGAIMVNTGARSLPTGALGTLRPVTVTPAAWRLDGTLNMLQSSSEIPLIGSTVGSPLEIRGTVNALLGEASIGPPTTIFTLGDVNVEDHATLNFATLIVNGGVFDVDGILNFSTTTFNALANLGITAGGRANLTGAATFNGGSYTGAGTMHWQSTAIVAANTTLGVETLIETGSLTTVASGKTLSIADRALVEIGAAFDGAGMVRNLLGSHLVLRPKANIAIPTVNEGTLQLENVASPIAEATVGTFTQSPSGMLEIHLGGKAVGSFDKLTVVGGAVLDGVLEVGLVTGFIPMIGDTFEILSAASVTGEFATEDLPDLGGLLWDVDYTASSVLLEVITPFTADFDMDGDVDGDDLAKWQTNYGTDGADADGDGDSDGADFLAWQRQYGMSIPSLSTASSTQVPEPAGLSFVGLGCVGLMSFRYLSSRKSICNR